MTRFAPYAIIVVLLAAVHAALVLGGLSPITKGELGDTDAYTRLLRVEALATGEGWFNSTLPQLNAPYGDDINWTRPLDLLIMAGALPLVAYADYSWREAIYWSGSWLAPVLHIFMALALAWAAAPLITPAARPLVALLAAVTPIMLAYNVAGRPDQQTLFLLALVLGLGWLIRGLAGWRATPRAGLYAGLWLGFALWVTVEAQFSFLILLACLGLIWLWRGERKNFELLESFALGFFTLTAIGILAERGWQWHVIRELDKISLSQALGAALISGLIGLLGFLTRHNGPVWRWFSTFWTVLAALVLVYLFAPELYAGPTGQMDPQVYQQFFLNILEMRPLWPVDAQTTTLLLLWLGVPLLAVPLWLWQRPTPVQPWLPLLALVVFFTAAALLHARFAQIAAPLAAIMLVGSVQSFKFVSRIALLIMPLLVAFTAVALAPDKAGGPAKADCNVKDIAPALNALPKGIIMAPIGYGPALAYFSHHGVVAGPYHRNTAGLRETMAFWGELPDGAAAALLTKRPVTWVLACPPSVSKPETARLAALGQGTTPLPSWLSPVNLPPTQDFKLYRVRD